VNRGYLTINREVIVEIYPVFSHKIYGFRGKKRGAVKNNNENGNGKGSL